MYRNKIVIGIIIILCVFQTGCAILQVPIIAFNLVTTIVGGAFQLAKRIPFPPPWVFF